MEIAASMLNEGCDNVNVKTTFTMLVDPDQIDTTSLTTEEHLHDSLQRVKWKTDKVPQLRSADGHHRFTALHWVANKLKDELSALETKRQELLDEDNDSVIQKNRLRIVETRIARAQKSLEPLGPWLVLFIDQSEGQYNYQTYC
jgi:hypothetical protein